jgi:hypothetical protein
MLPHKNTADTALYSSAPDVEVLSNTTDVHAVREKTLGITAANFWNPASVDFISAQNPASVMVKETDSELTVSVSDPTQQQSAISLELNKAGLTLVRADDTVAVLQTIPSLKLNVTVTGSFGKTHVVTFKKDTVAPVTTTNAKSDWQRTAQTVTLTASDEGSGVQKTCFSLDGGAFAEGNNIVVAEDGVHQLRYYSVDQAGNQEETKTAVIKIDTVAPVIAPTVTMDVYWTDGGSLQFEISDPVSGVASESLQLDGDQISRPYSFSPLSLSIGEHELKVKAVDAAGNETTAAYLLKVRMDANHLDEAARYAYQQSWITNQGILNSLLSKIEKIQRKEDDNQKKNEWKDLENHIRAQSGKKIDAVFAELLLQAIAKCKS